MVKSLDELLLFIEKGIPNGHVYTYRESADEYVEKKSGDVIFVIETLAHKTFERDKNNLKTKITITLRQALLGFKTTIKHLDGHTVEIDRSNKITKPGEVQKIKGEGMPVYEYPSDYGDLVITYKVKFPDTLTNE